MTTHQQREQARERARKHFSYGLRDNPYQYGSLLWQSYETQYKRLQGFASCSQPT